MNQQDLKAFLDECVERFNQPSFIDNDPISIAHSFSAREDIEVAGLLSAVFAWGQRKTSIAKCWDLLGRMDNAPYDFILNHKEADLRQLVGFVHRTFNELDAYGFVSALKNIYGQYNSLEDVLLEGMQGDDSIESGLTHLHNQFFALGETLPRTKKHFSSPESGSACKRLNMFLRWMVRKDTCGVDLGLWERISPASLIIPLDVHVIRVASGLKLMQAGSGNWKKALELTKKLSRFDPSDPVKYDFALFGLGILEKQGRDWT